MGGIKLGRWLGFPVEVRVSFLILLGVVSLDGLVRGHPLLSIALLVITFLGVLLHELGHAVVARRVGVPIAGIDLHVFGGAAKMLGMPKSARDEILIAAAGPAVSLALAAIGGLLYALTGFVGFFYLLWINLLLGVFNLLPALPMDGGRIFRAALSRRMGRVRATELSVKVAKGLAIAMGLYGLVSANIWLAALAVMLWFMAANERAQMHLWSYGAGDGYGRGGGFGSGGFGGGGGPIDREQVEVLDRRGRRVDRSAGQPVSHAGASFTVEEELVGGMRRWVLRDPEGRVLLRSEHPLN
jgi:Zn-dependent protease